MITPKLTSPFLKQTWVVSGVLISALAQGMVQNDIPIRHPTLTTQYLPTQTELNASWLVSSYGLPTIIGLVFSSSLMELFGRRLAYAFDILPGFIGLLLYYLCGNLATLQVRQSLFCITSGATFTLGAIIIGEYTSPEYRGMFLNFRTAAFSLGHLLGQSLSYFFHWRTTTVLILLLYTVSFSIVCTWPESPEWLVSKRRFYESKNEFYWLRGHTKESKRELDDMITIQEQSAELTKKLRLKDYIKTFTKMSYVKPIFIMFTAWSLLEMSGKHIFPAYAPEIVDEILGNRHNLMYYTLGIDFCITISAISSSILVRIIKMRTLLFVTGAASIIVIIAACTHLFLSSNDLISKDHHWMPLSMFILYFILVNLGCTTIPIMLMGEILPLGQKSSGLLASGLLSSLCMTASLKTFPFMLTTLKLYGTFAVLGILMTVTLSVLYFILPETKNRTLQEIGTFIKCGSYDGQAIKQEKGGLATHQSPLLSLVSPTVSKC